MFYEEAKINDIIKCPHCKKIFTDPRMLECGESMCNSCIMLLLNKRKTGLRCKICDQFHEMPKKGFIKSLRLAKLVEIKPNEAKNSKVPTEFKSVLNTINEKTNLNTDKNSLREHCDFVRSTVEVEVENWYQHIDKFQCEFIKLIDG